MQTLFWSKKKIDFQNQFYLFKGSSVNKIASSMISCKLPKFLEIIATCKAKITSSIDFLVTGLQLFLIEYVIDLPSLGLLLTSYLLILYFH